MSERTMEALDRLREIARIIEAVDDRCMAVDGPVTPTRLEMTNDELRQIYELATSEPSVPDSDSEGRIRLVRQGHVEGCGVAALAMVTGRSYADVVADFADRRTSLDSQGLGAGEVLRYLATRGWWWREWKAHPIPDASVLTFGIGFVLAPTWREGEVRRGHYIAFENGRCYDPGIGDIVSPDRYAEWFAAWELLPPTPLERAVPTTTEEDEMSETQDNPERIYLEPPPYSPEGRQWCEDDVWPLDGDGPGGVEYVRADLHAAEIARLSRELEEAREREREASETIDLAWQFVATARRDFVPGDDGYSDAIEQAEDLLWRARKTALAATPPDTEGEA